MVLSHFTNYQTQVPKTTSTVASQQYYYYPNGISRIDSVVITVGTQKFPLDIINSQKAWDIFNAIPVQPTTFPQLIFPRRNDFVVWPIPQDAYTITFNAYIRDRSLSVDDYTSGTVICTNGDATVAGTSTTFTPAMVGRWFTITDTTTPGEGYWFRIASYTSAGSIELENSWQDTTIATAVTYRIGQCPEIPEEGHIMLVDGVTADFYSGPRADSTKFTEWDNKFWTGSMKNDSRKIGDDDIKGGLIGLINNYSDRDEHALVRRLPRSAYPNLMWGRTAS